MSEIQGTAELDVAQVVAGLRQLHAGIVGLTQGLTVLNQKGEQVKRTLKDTFKDSAQAAAKAGGPVGSWTGRLFSGASMDGAFGRVAVGLSLLTVGMRAYQSVVDAAIDRTRLFIDAQRDMRDVADKTDKAIEQMAKKGESQAKTRADLIAVGGQNAAADADLVANTGAANYEEASKGVATIYGRFGDTVRAKNAVDIAMRGAMGGLDFGEVAKELTRHGGAIDDAGMADRLLGRMAMRQTGARGNPEEIWRNRMANINGDSFLMEVRRQQSNRSVIPGLERDAFMKAGLGSKDAAAAANPGAVIESEAFKKQTQAIEDLKKLAEAQTGAARILADVFQPGGSFQTQVDRMINAQAEARGMRGGPEPMNVNQAFPTGPYVPRNFGR